MPRPICKADAQSLLRFICSAIFLWSIALPVYAHGEEGMAALILMAVYALIFCVFLLVVLFLRKIQPSRAGTAICVYVACAVIAFCLPLVSDDVYGELNAGQFVVVLSGIPSIAGWISALVWLRWRGRVDREKSKQLTVSQK